MYELIKGQPLKENNTLVVMSDSGSYAPDDMILCAKAITPDDPYCKYECKYVILGNEAYN